MFGFLVGTACLAGLWAMRRHRRRWGGFHRHHHGHHYGFGSRGPGYGGRAALSWVMSRLETTPAQERVIIDEVETFMDKTDSFKREFKLSRKDVAKALRTDSFNEEVMGESFARQDDSIKEVREALVGSLARIHDVLDERQRGRLSDLLESGPRWREASGWRGYR